MSNAKPMIGRTFNELTVISRAPDRNGKPFYLCQCSCDSSKQLEVCGSNLRTGHSKSCGHLLQQRAKRELEIGETVNGWTVLRQIDDQF
jgi:hypothetical protein